MVLIAEFHCTSKGSINSIVQSGVIPSVIFFEKHIEQIFSIYENKSNIGGFEKYENDSPKYWEIKGLIDRLCKPKLQHLSWSG